jgi:hypothetical protein
MSEYRPIESAPNDRHIFVVNAHDPRTVPATVFWKRAFKTEPAGWYMSHTGTPYLQGPPTHWAPVNWVS